jgi:hypothetical protein
MLILHSIAALLDSLARLVSQPLTLCSVIEPQSVPCGAALYLIRVQTPIVIG